MLVEILSPEKKLFAGEVISAQFPEQQDHSKC